MVNFDKYFIIITSLLCEWWRVTIGVDGGLAPNRQHSIIYIDVDPVQRHIYVVLGGDEFYEPNIVFPC